MTTTIRHRSSRHRRVMRRVLGSRTRRAHRDGCPAAAAGPQYARTHQIPELAGRNTELIEAGFPICGIRTRTSTSVSMSTASASGRMHTVRCRWICASCPTATITADAMPSMLAFTEEDFAPAWEQCKQLLPCLADGDDRIGFQRNLLLHPGRRTVGRRITGRRRLLDRRSGVGDALRRRGEERWHSC